MKKLLVVLLILGFVAPAMAAEWNMYGSARVRFFYNNYNDDYMQSHGSYDASTLTFTPLGDESDTDLDMALQGNARIGANVKTSDVVSGRFEYGASDGKANIRLLYGMWNFGPGKLTIGQAYTPIDTLYSNQVVEDDNGLLFDGMTYEGRQPMIGVSIAGFQVALVKPSTSGIGSTQKDVTVPKIEVAFDTDAGPAKVGGYAAFQTYDLNDDRTVRSYVIGARAKINAGPLYVNPNVYYATNAADYGLALRDGHKSNLDGALPGVAAYNSIDDEDASTIGAAVAVGTKISDAFGVEAGVGYLKSSVKYDILGDVDLTTLNYYVQAPITLAPGVFIVPEITIVDLGKVETDLGDQKLGQITYYGAKFQINF